MRPVLRPLAARLAAAFVMVSAMASAHAGFSLMAIGTLSGTSDLSGLTGTLENGNAANILGGMGSGLAWAGGSTFLALPDRGPNAATYNTAVDNTTSYIARFNTVNLALSATPSAVPAGTVPYTLTPSLQSTTLLWSRTPLNYGSTAGLPNGAPSQNTADKYYFTGRSDGFAAGASSNPSNARLDPEAIRVSRDGKSVFVSDEYGPYVYQFDRATGERTRTFNLPANLAVSNLNAVGATEISSNTASGRITNKGMEGLAISPDGTKLIGLMQSPLAQDGGDGGRANRIVTIDIATGATKQFAYDNQLGTGTASAKNYNSSEIMASNDGRVWILERDGKGLGDVSSAKVKSIYSIDLSNAVDVSLMSGEAALVALAPTKTLVMDPLALLKAAGFADTQVPAKIEGMSCGDDVVEGGTTYHTLYLANDNDFVSGVAGDNKFYAFRFTDADLAAKGLGAFQNQSFEATPAVPEPETYVLALTALVAIGVAARRRQA
jgi:hypothetical protein